MSVGLTYKRIKIFAVKRMFSNLNLRSSDINLIRETVFKQKKM